MPNTAPKPCNHPGCGRLIDTGGYCEQHKKKKIQLSEQARGSSNDRGYGYKWQKARDGFLRKHPTCECQDCQVLPFILRPKSEVVDHKVDHKLFEAKTSGDPQRIAKANQLFWDSSNWQAMAKVCHDKKTAADHQAAYGRPGGHQKSGTYTL